MEGSLGAGGSPEAAELLLVAAHPFRDRLHRIAEVLDFGHDARQRSGSPAALAVLFDDRSQILVPIERCSADPRAFGDGGEGHGVCVAQQLSTCAFDLAEGVLGRHPACPSASRVSRRAMSRRWRSASSIHPRAPASFAVPKSVETDAADDLVAAGCHNHADRAGSFHLVGGLLHGGLVGLQTPVFPGRRARTRIQADQVTRSRE